MCLFSVVTSLPETLKVCAELPAQTLTCQQKKVQQRDRNLPKSRGQSLVRRQLAPNINKKGRHEAGWKGRGGLKIRDPATTSQCPPLSDPWKKQRRMEQCLLHPRPRGYFPLLVTIHWHVPAIMPVYLGPGRRRQ